MKQNEINTTLNSFFISQNEQNNRIIFKEFAHSLSSIIIDEFAQDYLLNNPYLSVYLAHTDGSMLLKKIKLFIAYVLTEPIDEEYVKKIFDIGTIHYSIKLDPAKVSYGFWAINEILNKLALTNEIVKENKIYLSKLFKFVEHMMNEGYRKQKEKQKNSSLDRLEIPKGSLTGSELTLLSSIKAMKNITEIFYAKDYQNIQNSEVKEIINIAVKETILREFSWAVKNISIEYDKESLNKNITKTIRHNSKNIVIEIELKTDKQSNYLIEIIYLLLDILELHFFVQERELSLIEFADKAESANKSKDMFLANMSHELRTPINAITGFSQILIMRKDTPDKVKKYVEKINIAGNNLLDLVNTILDFAKLESGKMQFNPALSNISNVLMEVKTLITPLAQKKEIELKMPNIISLNLYIDKTLFKQVLINLLTNAIKFTKTGGSVSLAIMYNENKRSYIFEVKDNGVGLDEEGITKLFQAFSQVDNVYQKEQKGSGLGLMICKTIVEELHNGKIWVESKKGEGSSFFIEMPTPMLNSNTYTINKAPKNSKNILIVEDSEEYQKILIDNLQETHSMTITDTVNKAKELIVENNYDFLILDFFLMDGISSEILHFMESENINIPAIVVSAEDEIHISKSLSGSSNLQCIINKNEVHKICTSLRGKTK